MTADAPTGAGNVSTAAPTSGAAVTLNRPPNTIPGDALVCVHFHHQSGGTLTPPAGWTSFGVQGSAVGTFDAWYRPIRTLIGEATSYTFTRTTGSDRQTAILFRVTSADFATLPDAVGALVVTGTSTIEDTAAAPVTGDALLLAFWASSIQSATPSAVTPPEGMTQVGTVSSTSGSSSTLTVAAQQLAAAGDTGSRTATVAPTANAGTGFMVTIRSAHYDWLAPAPWTPEFHAGSSAVDQLNTVSGALKFLLDPPRFRARRAVSGWALTEGVNNIPSWDTVDEDNYNGWSSSAPGRYTCQAAGWYQVTAAASLAGSGASGLVLIPGLLVNGSSPTGVGGVWEGPEMGVAVGGPKAVPAAWSVYLDVGDYVQLNVWYSTESSITATDSTAGVETRIELVWDGA